MTPVCPIVSTIIFKNAPLFRLLRVEPSVNSLVSSSVAKKIVPPMDKTRYNKFRSRGFNCPSCFSLLFKFSLLPKKCPNWLDKSLSSNPNSIFFSFPFFFFHFCSTVHYWNMELVGWRIGDSCGQREELRRRVQYWSTSVLKYLVTGLWHTQ